jgi:uncharacterized protein with FMN-binding domain
MLGGENKNLAGKLLLSSALVAVSVGYAWWHRHNGQGHNEAVPHRTVVEAPEPQPPVRATPSSAAPSMPVPSASKPVAVAAPPQHEMRLPAPVPISALASLRMYQPPPVQTPLPLVTGTPSPGATVPVPAGLEDGDYLSAIEQYEWGDLQVKISIHGGQITGVQMVQYPDHRAESLQISQMASPLLGSEVIKTQQAQVDIVSSATDTSYVFRHAIASAIKKASRQ